MMDEAVANLTCTLEANGFANNTILVISSDNGAENFSPVNTGLITGQSYPFRGYKGSYWRGGLSGTAIVHSKLLPKKARGIKYNGQVHITDWLPTLLGRATNGTWSGSYSNHTIDGLDIWNAMITQSKSPREEMVHGVSSTSSVLQYGDMKWFNNVNTPSADYPPFVFKGDQNKSASRLQCSNPSLIDF